MTSIQVRNEWGHTLRRLEWSHFLTLTSERPRSADRMLSEFRRYVRSVERIAQGRVVWFASAEEVVPGHAHVHALVNGTQSLSTERLEAQWQLGFSWIRCYDPRRNAAHYVSKQLTEDSYAFSFPKSHYFSP